MRDIKDVIINGVALEEILNKHEKWLNNEEDGEKADLNGVDLSYIDLKGVNLRGVDLSDANLRGTDLSYANLSYTNLRNADLSGAILRGVILRDAYLNGADLNDSNLSYAYLNNSNLSYTYLNGSNLSYTNLRNTDLRGAQLIDADLTSADLSYANLMGANLQSAILDNVIYNEYTSFFALQCPEKGSFIGYKKARRKIVELLITEDAKRSSGASRKCRCSKAKVLSITNIENTVKYDKVTSDYDKNFIYRVGKIVEVKDFDEDRWVECSTGIHFFLTRDEAVRY